jgi:hypothetical protein
LRRCSKISIALKNQFLLLLLEQGVTIKSVHWRRCR